MLLVRNEKADGKSVIGINDKEWVVHAIQTPHFNSGETYCNAFEINWREETEPWAKTLCLCSAARAAFLIVSMTQTACSALLRGFEPRYVTWSRFVR